MSSRRILVIVGLALVALGLVLGLVPITVGDEDSFSGDGFSCGSAFATNGDLSDTGHALCELNGGAANRRVWALGIIAAGVVILLGSAWESDKDTDVTVPTAPAGSPPPLD